MFALLLNFLFLPNAVFVLVLLILGSVLLFVSVLLHRNDQKHYSSTWTFARTRSQDVSAGPYRGEPLPVTSLVSGNAPWTARAASLSGHALSLYLAVFLPFFLSIVLDFEPAAGLSVVMMAAGLITRRSALEILDGNTPPDATSAPATLFATGAIAFIMWGVLRAPMPMQITLFHVVLPIWAAVQSTLIVKTASEARRIARSHESVGRQDE